MPEGRIGPSLAPRLALAVAAVRNPAVLPLAAVLMTSGLARAGIVGGDGGRECYVEGSCPDPTVRFCLGAAIVAAGFFVHRRSAVRKKRADRFHGFTSRVRAEVASARVPQSTVIVSGDEYQNWWVHFVEKDTIRYHYCGPSERRALTRELDQSPHPLSRQYEIGPHPGSVPPLTVTLEQFRKRAGLA
jgi:hypothetical protein